jgi:hypothetical protein
MGMTTPDRWPTRSVLVASFIPAGSSVIDLGAGAGGLEDRLPPGCAYTPADQPAFDMNKGKWPEGEYDVAVMTGVLEYARFPAAVLRHLSELAPTAIVTYAHSPKRSAEWINDLSPEEFTELAGKAGYQAEQVGTWKAPHIHAQAVWRLTR